MTTAQALGTELGRRLSVTLTPRVSREQSAGGQDPGNATEVRDDCLDEAIRVRRLDTWHVGWGRPRPSLIGIQAGSCAVFQVNGTIDRGKFVDVVMGGIGERRAEGYGQVSFNDPLLLVKPAKWQTRAEPEKTDESKTERTDPTLTARKLTGSDSDPEYSFASLIEREVWRSETRRGALRIAGDQGQRGELLRWSFEKDKPPMSQLGGLRNVLSHLHKPEHAARVLQWLKHLTETSRRADRWPQNALVSARRFLDQPDHVWTELQCDEWPTLTENAEERLKTELWPFAVKTLFDSCIRAHKRDLDRRRKPEGKGATGGA